jgi:peptidoglycan/LPS O-acetylase OafA/YrhL
MQSLSTSSSLLINLLKALAAQVIVFHHFTLYGPLAKTFALATPNIAWFFYEYGLHAVQVFFVIAGFLAGGTLNHQVTNSGQLVQVAWRRYKRLLVPLSLALVVVIGISALARLFTDDPIVPAAPTIGQFISHLLFLQGILQQPSLTVGVWYIGIDFQLYVLTALFALVANRIQTPNMFTLLTTATCFASILWFRSLSDYWDEYAVWFFFAYGYGVLVSQQRSNSKEFAPQVIVLIALFVTSLFLYAAFVHSNDWRFVTALATGLVLLAKPVLDAQLAKAPSKVKQLIETQGQRSFALFLMHFPASLLVNAGLDYWQLGNAVAGVAGVLIGWIGAMVFAVIFDHATNDWHYLHNSTYKLASKQRNQSKM